MLECTDFPDWFTLIRLKTRSILFFWIKIRQRVKRWHPKSLLSCITTYVHVRWACSHCLPLQPDRGRSPYRTRVQVLMDNFFELTSHQKGEALRGTSATQVVLDGMEHFFTELGARASHFTIFRFLVFSYEFNQSLMLDVVCEVSRGT